MAALRDNLNTSASCTLPEVPLHWRYSWDAENRLVAVAPAVPAAGDKKVVFTYDYMSRRVQKRVFAWDATLNGGTGDWEANPEVYQRFVYDQWNVVLVLDGPNRTITHKYTWGLDLSGLAGNGAQSRDREGAVPGIHAAGGIGGLLAVEAPQAVGEPLRHWYFYDGNGNVGQLLAYDATGPTVNAAPAAHYEYDPYGQLINYTDTIANPFRFSTKWFDTTTGLGYWGYRYYSPRLGRWMSRDPIGEEGGLNLHAYTRNRTSNTVDLLGLADDCGWPGCERRWPPQDPPDPPKPAESHPPCMFPDTAPGVAQLDLGKTLFGYRQLLIYFAELRYTCNRCGPTPLLEDVNRTGHLEKPCDPFLGIVLDLEFFSEARKYTATIECIDRETLCPGGVPGRVRFYTCTVKFYRQKDNTYSPGTLIEIPASSATYLGEDGFILSAECCGCPQTD